MRQLGRFPPVWGPPAPRPNATVTSLLGAGADPNGVDLGGVTATHRAVRNRCADAVRARPDVSYNDQRGCVMHVIDIVILVGWVAFWIYWFAAAVGVKEGQNRSAGFVGVRVVVLVAVLLLFRLNIFKGHGTTANPWLQGVGLALFVLGLALAIWARLYLGRNWGMPMSQKVDPELVTTGPYRTVRHPIYSGIILAMVGTAIAVSVYWLVAVLLLGGYFLYSAIMEERLMAGLFPDSYPAYKQSTKMIIPFIF
jgi:protein-S-isoprenylcysteine O-methyltransferase Ste14